MSEVGRRSENVMILEDLSTWLARVVEFLTEYQDLFLAWDQQRAGQKQDVRVSGPDYDRALERLRRILDPHPIRGFHCTRLRELEIKHILSAGMQTPEVAVLRHRVQALHEASLINQEVADRLHAENLAHENVRTGRIWFCFFPPRLAGQSGISGSFVIGAAKPYMGFMRMTSRPVPYSAASEFHA
jgi:hypothetical protein